MSLRSPLIQIICLLVGLLCVSFVARPGLPAALAEVRMPLVLVLVVALGYLELQLRQEPPLQQVLQQFAPDEARERRR